jgi:uncharacterized coiled-coil DUF342 family protein|tara:strand:+ start:750 stop:1334 length:585 start_codon:yes stop_codon:yes gene_type:complete
MLYKHEGVDRMDFILKKDLTQANDLYHSIKISRRKRNYQHKLLRAAKTERIQLNKLSREMVVKVQELKEKRDVCNRKANKFKEMRNKAVTKLHETTNKTKKDKYNKQQIDYHNKMMLAVDEAQAHHIHIDTLNVSIVDLNKEHNKKHEEVLFLRGKSEVFHADIQLAIDGIEAIKAKHNIKYLDYELAELDEEE